MNRQYPYRNPIISSACDAIFNVKRAITELRGLSSGRPNNFSITGTTNKYPFTRALTGLAGQPNHRLAIADSQNCGLAGTRVDAIRQHTRCSQRVNHFSGHVACERTRRNQNNITFRQCTRCISFNANISSGPQFHKAPLPRRTHH